MRGRYQKRKDGAKLAPSLLGRVVLWRRRIHFTRAEEMNRNRLVGELFAVSSTVGVGTGGSAMGAVAGAVGVVGI